MAQDILTKIVTHKKQEIKAAKKRRPEASLRTGLPPVRARRSFYDRLATFNPQGINIIAEIKRASPSKGLIRPNLDPAEYAREYESGGAAALSVLTDRHFFKGSVDDLKTARRAATNNDKVKVFLGSQCGCKKLFVTGNSSPQPAFLIGFFLGLNFWV